MNDEASQAPADRRIPSDRAAESDATGLQPVRLRRRTGAEEKLCGCGGRRFAHGSTVDGPYCAHLGFNGHQANCPCERYSAPVDGTPMHYVRSSNLDSIGYDSARERLVVRFSQDSAYAYRGVPRVLFDAMLEIARERGSVGGYLARSIKGTYPYERIPAQEA